jgi:RNA polymerase sigma factor (sigma-70 family)
MSFPQTRLTLVERLASESSEKDWREFLGDYWGPVCRFALRWGARDLEDAEDFASQTFEVLWENQLLVRWVSNRSAKLRTLLCTVVRNLLSQRNRVESNRKRLLADVAEHFQAMNREKNEHADAFYAAWVEDLVQRVVEALAAEYYGQSKDDYVRVFYGRLCQQKTIAEVADSLQIKPSSVDNYYRHVRRRLSEKLEEVVRGHVRRYARPEDADEEFAREWEELGAHLRACGGLEEAVRGAYELLDPVQAAKRRSAGLTRAFTRMTKVLQSPRRSGGTA